MHLLCLVLGELVNHHEAFNSSPTASHGKAWRGKRSQRAAYQPMKPAGANNHVYSARRTRTERSQPRPGQAFAATKQWQTLTARR